METAVQVGKACNLIKAASAVVRIQTPSPREVSSALRTLVRDLPLSPLAGAPTSARPTFPGDYSLSPSPLPGREGASNGRHKVLVISGRALATVFANTTLCALFRKATEGCQSVVCCRVTPLQKAMVVSLIKTGSVKGAVQAKPDSKMDPRQLLVKMQRKTKRQHTCLAIGDGATCLAIGDGGNDVAMIQAAHVGVGIAGREGLQAARGSDICLPDFQHLRRLIGVHGRLAYRRTAWCVQYSFYKSLLIGLGEILFNLWAASSGTSLITEWD
ncbi:P-type ATPase, subfamily IV, partial [Kipferlia bialata]|eukprot:g11140.t1